MKEAINVDPVFGEEYGSKARDVGTGKVGLYKKPKKKRQHEYTRKAPNYQATDVQPGSGIGGAGGGASAGGGR